MFLRLATLAVRTGPYLLLAALFLLRAAHPRADPPYFLDWSGGLYFDEGAYTHNARNKLLFGEWRLDQWNNMYYSPVHNLLVYGSFSLFGIGLWQERLVAITLSGLALLLFYLALRRAFGEPTALLGSLLLGTNYLFVMFGRLGLFEVPVTFAGILTLFCFGQAVAGGAPAWFFLAGAAAFLVYVFKNLAVYVVAAAVLAAGYETLGTRREGGAVRLAAFLAGLAAAVAVWLVTFYLPNREPIGAIGQLWLAQSLPASAAQLATNLATQPFFVAFARIPVVALLGMLGLGLVAYLLLRARAALHPLELLAGAWLGGGAVFLALLSYRPVRYYIPLIPPACLLAVRLLARAWPAPAVRERARRDPVLYLGLGLGALAVAFSGLLPYLGWGASLTARALLAVPVAAVLVGAALLVFRPWTPGPVRLPRAIAWGLAVALAAAVAGDLYQYWRWERSPVRGMYRISRELGKLPGTAVIAGLASPALVLENRHRAIYAGREGWFDATPDLFERYPVSHLLLATYNEELVWYYRTFPEVMARARLLKIYHVWRTYLFLYSLRDGESPRALYPTEETAGYDAAVDRASFPSAVEPEASFRATIAWRNVGSQPWQAADRVLLAAREGRDPFTADQHPLPTPRAAPAEVVTFSLPMHAPAKPGLYVTSWQMVKDGAFRFGEPYLAVIWVRPRS